MMISELSNEHMRATSMRRIDLVATLHRTKQVRILRLVSLTGNKKLARAQSHLFASGDYWHQLFSNIESAFVYVVKLISGNPAMTLPVTGSKKRHLNV